MDYSFATVNHQVTGFYHKKAQLWLRNPRNATAFQLHPEEIHRN